MRGIIEMIIVDHNEILNKENFDIHESFPRKVLISVVALSKRK